MEEITALVGGRTPRSRNKRTLAQYLIGLPKLAILPLKSLHLLGDFVWEPRPRTIVHFRLLHPFIHRLRPAADLGGDRGSRCPSRGILALGIQNHPHCSGADFR